jgi:hypothetical protein
MTPSRMVHVRTVPTSFHARVIAARLGSDGIVLLLADEVESALCFPTEEEEWSERPVLYVWTAWRLLAVAGVVLVLLATLSTRVFF